MARFSRLFGLQERTALLEALHVCRDTCCDLARYMPLGEGEKGATYRANDAFLAAVDDYVEHLCGDRARFHLNLHANAFAPQTPACDRCMGARWVCEAHPDLPWTHDGCTEAGAPCPLCNAAEPPAPPPGFRSLVK